MSVSAEYPSAKDVVGYVRLHRRASDESYSAMETVCSPLMGCPVESVNRP